MKLIVGLGNFKEEYNYSRHNLGFMVIDELSKQYNFSLNKSSFDSVYTIATIEGEEIVVAKPTTMMNLSGSAILQLKKFFNVNNEDILIVHDDMTLDLSKYEIKNDPFPNGHNGIKSVFTALDTQNLTRVKIGIGKSPFNLRDYVLEKFKNEELQQIPFNKITNDIKKWIIKKEEK